MKRHALASAGALLGGVLLAAAVQAQTAVTVTGAGNAQTFALFETWVADYNAQARGVTATWQAGPREAGELQQQLLRDSLVGAKLPDVVLFTGPLLSTLHERDLVVGLDAMIAADADWTKDIAPAVTAPATIGGSVYGMAYGVSMPVVVFNADLVAQAGGDPRNLPRDWPGILSLAKRIDGIAPNVVGGFMEHDNGLGFSWLTLLESQGGKVMDPANKAFTFQDRHGLAALKLLRGFGEAGQAKADMSRDQARQAFGAGGVGVLGTMSSLISRYEKESAGKFQVVSVPFPVAPGGGKVPVSSVTAAMLTRDAPTQKAAFDLMKFMAGPQGQVTIATTTGYAPANAVAIARSAELKAVLDRRANAHAYLDNLDNLSGWYMVPGDNGLRIANMFTENLQQVATFAATPEAALQTMESEAAAMFKP